MPKTKTPKVEIEQMKELFGDIPEEDKNVIDSLCDTFMEAVDTGDDVRVEKDVRNVFTESLTISFYAGMMKGIRRQSEKFKAVPVPDCPLRNSCKKREPAN